VLRPAAVYSFQTMVRARGDRVLVAAASRLPRSGHRAAHLLARRWGEPYSRSARRRPSRRG